MQIERKFWDEPPAFFLSACKRQKIAAPMSRLREQADYAKRHPGRFLPEFVLLVGMKVCARLQDKDFLRNNRAGYGTKKYAQELRLITIRRPLRKFYTVNSVKSVATMLLIGYMQARDIHEVKRHHWKGLIEEVGPLLLGRRDSNEDYFNVIKLRLNRARRIDGKLPFDLGARYFAQVEACLQKRARI